MPRALLAVALAFGLPSFAAIAGQASNQPASPAAQTTSTAREIDTAAAAAITRIVWQDLSQVASPSPREFRIAALALEVAHDLVPEDEEILRRLIEAQDSAGERGRVLELTRRLIRLSPEDTVAQLRLISAQIAALQNADARLTAYDRFLLSSGAAIDSSILSRLALDAALLLRERGDTAGFVRRLSQSTMLDSTNKEAAAMALAFFTQRVDDPVGRLELLLNLLNADPIDDTTLLNITRELTAGGAYVGARRFAEALRIFYRTAGETIDAELAAELEMTRWFVDGPDPVVSQLRDYMDAQRRGVRAQIAEMRAAGTPEDEIPSESDVSLAPPAARLVLIAAVAGGDADMVNWAMNEVKSSNAALRGAAAKAKAGGSREAPALEQAVEQAENELLWLRLWANRDIEQAAARIEELRNDERVDPNALARLQGWLMLRNGEAAQAEAMLRPLSGADPIAAMGIAVAMETAGDAAGAAAAYSSLSQTNAGTMAAAFARARYTKLTGRAPPQPANAEQLESLITGVPTWLEGMLADPRRFMSLNVEPVTPQGRLLTPVAIRVRLTNTSPIPLAVGPDLPINSRFLFTPFAEVGLGRLPGAGLGEVVSLDRRLRMEPRRSAEFVVRMDLGPLWSTLDIFHDRPVRIRWQALQGFRADREGRFVAGTHCLDSETGVFFRSATSLARAEISELVDALTNGTPARAIDAAASLLARWPLHLSGQRMTEEQLSSIVGGLTARYPQLERGAKMLLLGLVPPSNRVPELKPFDDLVKSERDPAVLAFVLLTRATDAQDARLLEVAAGGGMASIPPENERTRELAELIRSRLADNVPSYSSYRPPPPPAQRSTEQPGSR